MRMVNGFWRWSGAVGLCLTVALAGPAAAQPRAVVELFTSQGCSSCPPADKILGDLARDPSVIALTLPIDYWDYLGWKDTLADARFSARQKAYSQMRGDREVYTPQAIVNGAVPVVGSNRTEIESAIRNGGRGGAMMVPVSVAVNGKEIKVSVAAALPGEVAKHGEVWICSVAKAVPITIGRGENSGQQIVYHNVVRNLLKVGDWSGGPGQWSVPLENVSGEGVDAAAVYVQNGSRDRPGAMLGAAFTSLN